MQRHRLPPRIAAEEPHLAGVGPQEPEEDAAGWWSCPNRWAEEPVQLAGAHRQVESVEGPDGAERFTRPVAEMTGSMQGG